MKKFTALICLCAIVLLTGCTIPTNSSASVLTATSLTDEVVVTRSYDGTNKFIQKVVSKRFTNQYEYYKENGYLESPDENFEFNWGHMLDDMLDGIENPTKNNYGYALKDINGDGIEELFYLRSDGVIYSIFTYLLDNTVMLGVFHSDRECRIMRDGTILTVIKNDDGHTSYEISTLPEKGNSFKTTITFGGNGKSFYKIIDGKHTVITKEEFDKFMLSIPEKNDYPLDFIPYPYE